MPRAVVVVNPSARAGARPPVGRMLAAFREAGWQAEVWAGEGSGWATDAACRAVAQGASAVFGAGGDGLLADLLVGLLGTHVALGVVPLGTGNVWARELGLPLEPGRAIAAQLARPPARVDVGRANGRPFLVIASAGLDAQIVRLVEAGSKGWGQIAYPLAGVSLAKTVRGTPCRVQLDGEPPRELELLTCIATNGRLYGGLFPLVSDARLDDGLLDVALFLGSGPIAAAAHVARVVAGWHRPGRDLVLRRLRRLQLEALARPLPVQTDGDPRGTTPLEVEVLPGALLTLGAG